LLALATTTGGEIGSVTGGATGITVSKPELADNRSRGSSGSKTTLNTFSLRRAPRGRFLGTVGPSLRANFATLAPLSAMILGMVSCVRRERQVFSIPAIDALYRFSAAQCLCQAKLFIFWYEHSALWRKQEVSCNPTENKSSKAKQNLLTLP
jgi:hypothetical protein